MQYLSFEDCLAQNGYPSTHPVADGRIHRFGKGDRYWYVHRTTYAVAGDWTGELEQISWHDNQSFNSYSGDRKRREWQEIQRQRRHAEHLIYLEQQNAKEKAKIELSTAIQCTKSKYLDRKKLSSRLNIFYNKYDQIIIPISSTAGEITSLQYICYDGKKRFLQGGQIRGCFHQIGDKIGSFAYICEGYATGLTVHEITKEPVIVCFSAGNIIPLLDNMKKKYPDTAFVIAGDNDAHRERNIGKEKAEEASKKFNIQYIIPQFKDITTLPTDWNDLYLLEGSEEVLKQLTLS